jgi:hypothetical protein
MNPNDIPVKFPLHTRVKIIKGNNVGHKGSIIEERRDGRNNHVSFDGGGHAWFSDHELEALPIPEVGDLVRITKTGRWQAHEGHITGRDGNYLFVDVDYDWERPEFLEEQLEVIEKVKPKPVRIEGQPIKPEAIKRGDRISVVSVDDSSEIKKTTILEATVDKVIPKGFNGQHIEFQTRTGSTIHTTVYGSTAVISLVADIDKDVDFHALSLIKPNEIIGFPDEEGGIEINIAVKLDLDNYWSVMLGAKKSKNMETAGLVAILKKKNVTFSVIRAVPTEPEFEFPKGTHVKVSSRAGLSLTGDYKVLTPSKEFSVIKSRGISASTHTVANTYLIKD